MRNWKRFTCEIMLVFFLNFIFSLRWFLHFDMKLFSEFPLVLMNREKRDREKRLTFFSILKKRAFLTIRFHLGIDSDDKSTLRWWRNIFVWIILKKCFYYYGIKSIWRTKNITLNCNEQVSINKAHLTC